MKKKVLYAVISLAIIIASFMFSGFLMNSKPLPKKDSKKHNIMYVKAGKAEQVEVESNLNYRGRVISFDNVSLAAEVSGKLVKGNVRFKTGESFRKNQRLINIYSKDVEAALKSGKSSFMQTLSKILPDLRVDYSSEYLKWSSFFNEIDPNKTLPKLPEINSEKEKVFLASNNVLASYYNLQQQEINLSRYTIYAPFNGSFKKVNKEIGAVASPGVELATIIRSDKLEIVTPVFPDDLKWIKKGGQVLIEIDGNEEVATISRISGFVDETTQSVNVYITYYPSAKNSLLEGEYVDVKFSGGIVSGFEIPREALVDNDHVYLLTDSRLVKSKVKVERLMDDAAIISGIAPNKVIVTESLASVDDNVEYQSR